MWKFKLVGNYVTGYGFNRIEYSFIYFWYFIIYSIYY